MRVTEMIVLIVGLIILSTIWGAFMAVGAVFGLMTSEPFLAGLLVGIGLSALVGHRLVLRNRQLEAQNKQLEQAVDSFLRQEGAL